MININDTPGEKITKTAVLMIAWPYYAVEKCHKSVRYLCMGLNVIWLPIGLIPFLITLITGVIVLISEK